MSISKNVTIIYSNVSPHIKRKYWVTISIVKTKLGTNVQKCQPKTQKKFDSFSLEDNFKFYRFMNIKRMIHFIK